jgi:hypothetical protein
MITLSETGRKIIASKPLIPTLAVFFSIGGFLYFINADGSDYRLPHGIETPLVGAALSAMVIILLFYLISIKNRVYSTADWGCPINKRFWIIFGTLAALLIIHNIVSSGATSYDLRLADNWSLVGYCVTIFSLELILRVLLIDYLLKIFGKGRIKIFWAILISGILFYFAESPIYPFSLKAVAAAVVISWLYYAGGVIYLCLFFDVLKRVPESHMWLAAAIMTVLYFAFAVPGLIVEKNSRKTLHE